MFRSVLIIVSGNATTSLMLLLRNLFVARLISVEDYGVAATFAISMAIVEMMTTLGLQQLIVQDREGNDPQLQAGLQGFHLLRGCIAGLLLFLLAGPIAQFLNIPEVTWAYQLLALVPVLNGLTNFDIFRLQRRMIFFPSIVSNLAPALISLALTWPLFQVYGDYRVMLYAVLVQGAGTALTSHLVAERRYRLVLKRDIIVQALKFGWPLLINNIFLFLVFQGEKMVVGREIGMESLALLAMGFTLTLTPTLVLAKSAQSFFLPQLSASKEDETRFSHLSSATLQASLLNGLLLVVGIALIGAPVVRFLLGEKYEALIPLLTWLAILHAARVFKSGSTVVALSRAHTENAMIANAPRVLSIPLSWYVAATSGDLLQIIWIATIGEFFGYAASLAMLVYRIRPALKPMVLPISGSVALLATAAGIASTDGTTRTVLLAAMLLLFALVLVTMSDFRHYVLKRALTKYSD